MARKKADEPYKPAYTGFDEEATRRAQATAERAREHPGAKGEWADADAAEEGPAEAARRMGETPEDVGASVERAKARKR